MNMVLPSDTAPSRTVPMEVLVLGLCRTGTMSMKLALEKLGYGNVYHMSSIFDDESHAGLWISALETKYSQQGEVVEKHEEQMMEEYWDRILGGYSAMTDIPCVCFVPELLAAYPDAKVILTTRSPASWRHSMLRTIYALQYSRVDRFFLSFATPHLKLVGRVMDLIFENCLKDCGEEVLIAHEEMVREQCRILGREVLEFELGAGWNPLCQFLGKENPRTEWPHVNDSHSFRRTFRLDAWSRGSLGAGLVACFGIVGWFAFA